MTWVVILLLAGAAFAVMAVVLKMPRAGWEITGAALLFGISGYALQGHPGLAGAPKQALEDKKVADAELLKERAAMGDRFGKGQSWLVLADGLSRQGQYGAAATVLGKAVEKEPGDADLWVALGNALVGHSDGLITPAAQFAFQKAATISPEHPGPPFFMGLALAQSGRLADARAIWAELLRRSPADAPYRQDLESRLQRIDSMLAAAGQAPAGPAGAGQAGAGPAAPEPAPAVQASGEPAQ